MGLIKEKEMPGSSFKAFAKNVIDTAKGQKGIDALTGATQPGRTKQRVGKGLLGFGLLFIVLGVILGFVASEKPGPTEAQRAAGEKTDGQKMSMAAAIMSLIGVASMLAAYYIR
jgi:hypothetical protein